MLSPIYCPAEHHMEWVFVPKVHCLSMFADVYHLDSFEEILDIFYKF